MDKMRYTIDAIDAIDRNIFEEIQKDARISIISLGEMIGVPASPC